MLTCSKNIALLPDSGKFAITDTNLYTPVVTLSGQKNTELLQQLKSRPK